MKWYFEEAGKRAILVVILMLFSLVMVGAFVSPAAVTSPQPVIAHPIEAMLFESQQSTVRLSVVIDGEWTHIGSGFVASDDGFIVTARHVADFGPSFRVFFSDGTLLNAEVVLSSTFTDCAVLKADGCGWKYASLRAGAVHLGECVFVIGSPMDELFEHYVTRGIVGKISVDLPNISLTDLFMVDAAINPGNSGGPVFDERGAVVGIAVAKVPYADEMGFVVRADDIADTLEKAKVLFEADQSGA